MRTDDPFTFDRLKALTAGRARIDAACPACGPHCKTTINQRRKVLRIWNEGDFLGYYCARCGASGYAKADGYSPTQQPRPKPEPEPIEDKAELARFLWSRSLQARGSLVEVYLKSRHCWIESPNIRFLPGRGEHPPAMVSRFGEGTLTGVHLTKLAPDGKGKSGSDKDKIMVGPSVGQAIVIVDNPDRGELLIAEGIEDASSLALVTGWSARAAGAAARIPQIVDSAKGFERVYLAVDRDRAGMMALQKARKARRDIVPVHFSKTLDGKDALDANKALIRFGADAVLAAIEWCEAQASFRLGQIGFHAMQAAMQRANTVFGEMVAL